MIDHLLWYRSPAAEWTDALPLGNGRLGAMVFGGVVRDEFQLNEDTLWSGGPYVAVNPEAYRHLETVRELIFAGCYAEAQDVANVHLMGRPYLQTSYQPAGRLLLGFDHATLFSDYRRSLDLKRALATTTYTADGVAFRRESFVSAADGVLVIRVTADRPGSVSFGAEFVSEQPGAVHVEGNALHFDGRNRAEVGIPGKLRWALDARVLNEGGAISTEADRLVVAGVDNATILLDIATSFRRFDDVSGDPQTDVATRLDAAAVKSYDELLANHLAAHGALYDRFDIDLDRTQAADQPTDLRIAGFTAGDDPDLAALYVRFGRYLAIASSRPGTQPANLQGIWNKEIRPPWGSKYTSNINVQMNYWLPDVANLGDCVEPLVRMVEELAVTGAKIARAHYSARGWVLHHNTDLWRATGPVDGAQWGLWPTGGAWLCAQLWDHARFAGFPEALVERLYPLLAGASRFFIDTLVQLPGTEFLVTAPSVSPENVHPHGSSLCAGPTMDNQILRDLFAATIAAAHRLDRDHELAEKLMAISARLPADRIGAQGQLQEWPEDWDADVPEIHHRHVSHLYGVYPSLQISPERTPELALAARRSLEIRGDDATGWGIGWRINLWARLGDGDRAHSVLARLLHPERSYRNLFDAHPPFQIDGNFGGAAGILEMLVQSDEEQIRLLPACPKRWTSGAIRGVRARGGVELDFGWAEGSLTALTVRAMQPYTGSISHRGSVLASQLPAGETLVLGSPTS
ncbi:glycoside hydrolase family 95 protein [Devosia nitrariae]|uniref:Alpha/beta hydrolase n=1 Tax=Devosia nitrariae TaxID=2071872 RepID=A0ABQ5W8Z6_9HYPH|nr:glycoside hydrolase family 95 protein [Devosia nitrariae]GLQ56442.1 alpha/beta hydrolase [Devosia nitrariae]